LRVGRGRVVAGRRPRPGLGWRRLEGVAAGEEVGYFWAMCRMMEWVDHRMEWGWMLPAHGNHVTDHDETTTHGLGITTDGHVT
jgi:hypothetical protein